MINVKNLKKLRKYLAENITQKKFDMLDYRGRHNHSIISFRNCGSVGCMVGWLPFALRENNQSTFNNYKNIFTKGFDWDNYLKYKTNIELDSELGEFLFDSEWAEYDNTLEGALGRLDFVIDNPNFFDAE